MIGGGAEAVPRAGQQVAAELRDRRMRLQILGEIGGDLHVLGQEAKLEA